METLPKWTVLYNIANGSNWVGTGWEFFDTKEEAEKCYQLQRERGNCPTRRPFYKECDIPHMGASHRHLL